MSRFASTASGAAEYKEDPKDDGPLKFQLSRPTRMRSSRWRIGSTISLSRLESGLKVANMGMKTFRYDEATAKRH